MTLLACLTAGGALLVAQASQAWRDRHPQRRHDPGEARRQRRRRPAGRQGRRDRRPERGAGERSRLHRRRLAKAPSSPGSATASISRFCRSLASSWSTCAAGATPDVAALRAALAQGAPQADLDDHRVWAARIGVHGQRHRRPRGGAVRPGDRRHGDGDRLRDPRAPSRKTARSSRFCTLSAPRTGSSPTSFTAIFSGWVQGAAIGGGAAIAFFLAAAMLSHLVRELAGRRRDRRSVRLFRARSHGYAGLLMVAPVVALLTGLLSRKIVLRHLRALQ